MKQSLACKASLLSQLGVETASPDMSLMKQEGFADKLSVSKLISMSPYLFLSKDLSAWQISWLSPSRLSTSSVCLALTCHSSHIDTFRYLTECQCLIETL